ncbi:MAG: hypothetical protein DRH04_03970 [Deltaproteobacteria bacterium]|nr:MAG: hypothetical protein DRH04_03970 [Deltaproteobacteria bacterium]
MVQKLKVKNDFTPCPAVVGDELYPNGIFVFNITRMIEYIENNHDRVTLQEVSVDDFFESFSTVNESHVDSVDISRPIILAEIAPGHYSLIDGKHRVAKARRMGIKNVPAYKLNVDQHLKFLINKEGYVAYVEYWNSKLK